MSAIVVVVWQYVLIVYIAILIKPRFLKALILEPNRNCYYNYIVVWLAINLIIIYLFQLKTSDPNEK